MVQFAQKIGWNFEKDKKVWRKYKGLLFPSKWCFSRICFFCLPQAEK
jgi:hypothetical protein